MPVSHNAEGFYLAATRFADECLRRGESLFNPGRPIWTQELAADLYTRFVENPDEAEGDFTSKLIGQLEGGSADVFQLAAEMYFILLAPQDTDGTTRRPAVEAVLAASPAPLAIPEDLLAAFDGGIASYGSALAHRFAQYVFLCEFVRAWTPLDETRRDELLADPDAFHAFVYGLPRKGASSQVEALLHMVFPDSYEPIVSIDWKKKIAEAFSDYVDDPLVPLDHQLAAIREALEEEHGKDFDFWKPEIREVWEAEPTTGRRAWIVRGERAYGTNLVPRWIDEGFVSMGAADEGRIEPGMSVKEIIDLVQLVRPDMTRQQIRGGATSGRYFASEISVGDCVLTRDGERVYIGRVTSDQTFVPDDQAGTARRRQVEWVNRDEPLSWGDLPKALRERATNPNTVWELKGQVETIEHLIGREDSGDEALWEPFLYWAARLYEDREKFGAEERDYKLAIAGRMAAARTALEAGDASWLPILKRAFGSPNNLTSFYAHGPFLDACAANPAAAESFLSELWSSASLDAETVAKADEAWFDPSRTNRSTANRLSIFALLFMAVDPESYPPYRSTAIDRAMNLLGVPKPSLDDRAPDSDLRPEQVATMLGVQGRRVRGFLRKEFERPAEAKGSAWPALTAEQLDAVFRHFGKPGGERADEAGRRYAVFLDLLDEMMERMAARGTPLRDRLDAQGLLWWITSAGPPDEWSAADQAAFLAYQERKEDGVETDLRALARELFIEPAEWLEEIVELLFEKRQVIFFGPPGTGKTYVAQALAQHLTRGGGDFDLIQFHPSYGYEDFFEGFRPLSSDGELSYVLTPGPLRVMAARAQEDPDNPYVLIVDEINRGNVPKIFGELLFLLEYRDRAIALQYSPSEPFSLPPNLYLIGTMNTADRSIALVDSALRRRFYFVEFSPNQEPVLDVLKLWLDTHGLDDEPDRVLRVLNERIVQSDIAIGPSYFMTADGSQPDLDRVWRHSIIPLLDEYFYDAGTDVETEYGLAALRAVLQTEALEALPATEPQGDESPAT